MQEVIDALEAEITKLQQTVSVVTALKPIQRQQDQCVELIRDHIIEMANAVGMMLVPKPPVSGTTNSRPNPIGSGGQAAQALPSE